jgi:hypothetical protein
MTDFDEYRDLVFDFEKNRSSATYEERVGPPEELPAVIGLITLHFQALDEELSKRIAQMINSETAICDIVTAELSFQNKLNLFASLYYLIKSKSKFNAIPGFQDQHFEEIIKACVKCEEFRNQIIHSSIVRSWETDFKIIRKKKRAKIKKGFVETNQEIDIPYLFDISDFIISIVMEIEEYFINFQISSSDN